MDIRWSPALRQTSPAQGNVKPPARQTPGESLAFTTPALATRPGDEVAQGVEDLQTDRFVPTSQTLCLEDGGKVGPLRGSSADAMAQMVKDIKKDHGYGAQRIDVQVNANGNIAMLDDHGLAGIDGRGTAHQVKAEGLAGAADVLHIGTGDALEVMSTSIALNDHEQLVVFESADPNLEKFLGLSARIVRDGVAQPACELRFENLPPFVGAPSLMIVDGKPYLYLAAAQNKDAPPQLYRAPVGAGGSIQSPEPLDTIPGMDKLTCWPRFTAFGDGYAVTFRSHFKPMVAVSRDGKTFEPPSTVAGISDAAMAAVGPFGEHGLALTYQTHDDAVPDSMTSWVVTSPDTKTWSPPQKITTSSQNVHDTAILPRRDGGVDLYYEFAGADTPYSLYRRPLDLAGQKGPEQRLTDSSIPDAMKPCPGRLADGRPFLSFAQGVERDPVTHFPTRERIDAIVLAEDAPLA
jgi:hypothetical protein